MGGPSPFSLTRLAADGVRVIFSHLRKGPIMKTSERLVLSFLVFHLALAMAVPLAFAVESPPIVPDGGVQGPRVDALDPALVGNDAPGYDACQQLLGFTEQGWELVHPTDFLTPRVLEGEVVAGHPPHGDFYFNHDTEDHDFFVFPDDHNLLANDPTANYHSLLGSGNFETGEPKEWGRIEVEWEYGAHTWNDAADSGYYGFPTWAWPNIGDRVHVEGFWIFDCGHEPFRAEIHPAWMVVTYRNAMQSNMARGSNRKGAVAALGPDDRDMGRVSRADVFISSFGGEAVDNIFDDDDFYGPDCCGTEDWWQPVNRKDYDFDIIAPPSPSPGAELVWTVLEPPSSYVRPPGAVEPTFTIAPFTRANGSGEAVHVHVNFSAVPDSNYLLFAKTILVGYDVKEPEVRHYKVTFNSVYTYDDQEGPSQAEYSVWAHSGEQNIYIRNSNGLPDEDESPEYSCDSDGNYMPYCSPDEDESNLLDGSFERFLGPEDELVISVHIKEGEDPVENDDSGFADAAYTDADDWGVGTHTVRQSDMAWAGEYDNDPDCDGPDGACYDINYTIDRIIDPTALTIGIDPPFQYAQDPNHFTATVVTPGPPDKPRRRLPVSIDLSGPGGAQLLQGTTSDAGLAKPGETVTLPGGTYEDNSSFDGNGLLAESSATQTVTVLKDFTQSALDAPEEMRWGHHDPFTLTLIEPNDPPQEEGPLPVEGKNMTVTLTGLQGTLSFPAGPTDAAGSVTITPLMTLPPGNYQATACFEEDPWFLGSCSAAQPVKITPGFAGFARGGPVDISGTAQISLGDLHSEGALNLGGNAHVLSAGAGERLEYVTTFTNGSVGSTFNLFQVPALGIAPIYLASTYCGGASVLMGVPVQYISGNMIIKNDTVLSGIYCVDGGIKIQARVTGTATLVATGTINRTAGGSQSLMTADPTGADLLMFSGSSSSKALVLNQSDAFFKGVIFAKGGIELSGMRSTVDTAIIGNSIIVKGANNTLDGR
jgi:hypothetical protein